MTHFAYDIETYPNCFTIAIGDVDAQDCVVWEISDRANDVRLIIEAMNVMRLRGDVMVGYNNEGFDYPVMHLLMELDVNATAFALYEKAQRIIDTPWDDRFCNIIWESSRFVKQLDLFKVMHFDNLSKSTKLKELEVKMHMEKVQELPYKPGSTLTDSEMQLLGEYNKHDWLATKLFFHKVRDAIKLREHLTQRTGENHTNYNDKKIGNRLFIRELEKVGVQCYSKDPTSDRRTVRQTPRLSGGINLNECILPTIKFKHPPLQQLLEFLKSQTIYETKEVFKERVVHKGLKFTIGLGGAHASQSKRIFQANNEYIIEDIDVTSYYPSLLIENNFYPKHLGQPFVEIYKKLKKIRLIHDKKTTENKVYKLALNGTFGDTNEKYSPFYDPKCMIRITLNGQLLLCMLAEQLMELSQLEMIQVNTDGITIRYPRIYSVWVHDVVAWWEQMTGLQMEYANYSRMFVRDVNNYIAEYVDGTVKTKGAYQYQYGADEWHKNQSAKVVAHVANEYLLHGKDVRTTLMTHTDYHDFMLNTKIPNNSSLLWGSDVVQNVSRYYVSKEGKPLTKLMPPTPEQVSQIERGIEVKTLKQGMRHFAIQKGFNVCVCNNWSDATMAIDFDYYIQAVEKLTLKLKE